MFLGESVYPGIANMNESGEDRMDTLDDSELAFIKLIDWCQKEDSRRAALDNELEEKERQEELCRHKQERNDELDLLESGQTLVDVKSLTHKDESHRRFLSHRNTIQHIQDIYYSQSTPCTTLIGCIDLNEVDPYPTDDADNTTKCGEQWVSCLGLDRHPEFDGSAIKSISLLVGSSKNDIFAFVHGMIHENNTQLSSTWSCTQPYYLGYTNDLFFSGIYSFIRKISKCTDLPPPLAFMKFTTEAYSGFNSDDPFCPLRDPTPKQINTIDRLMAKPQLRPSHYWRSGSIAFMLVLLSVTKSSRPHLTDVIYNNKCAQLVEHVHTSGSVQEIEDVCLEWTNQFVV